MEEGIPSATSMDLTREQMAFKHYSPRSLYRRFLNETINNNDWAIAWIATTANRGPLSQWLIGLGSVVGGIIVGGAVAAAPFTGGASIAVGAAAGAAIGGGLGGIATDWSYDIDEGNSDFGPTCEAFAAWIRTGFDRSATYQWMLEHQEPGNHDQSALAGWLKGAGRTIFGFIDDIFKHLWR